MGWCYRVVCISYLVVPKCISLIGCYKVCNMMFVVSMFIFSLLKRRLQKGGNRDE